MCPMCCAEGTGVIVSHSLGAHIMGVAQTDTGGGSLETALMVSAEGLFGPDSTSTALCCCQGDAVRASSRLVISVMLVTGWWERT